MWDVRDVDIINNTFNGHGGFNYEDRGVGITAFDANIRAFAINNQGNHFNNLYHGIDGWFTGITFSPDVITHNVFDRCWGGVYLNSAPISFIHNNRVFNIPRGDTDPGFGVWMDGSRLFEINQDNHFIGDPNWVPNHGTNYGVVATNSANWGRTIDHNIFDETVIGTQAEGDNPQLDIRCNTYTNHEAHAWAVLEKNNIGVLQDQGTGTQTQDIRPQNTFAEFVICPNGEDHIYSEYLFNYFVFNNTSMAATYPQCSSPILFGLGVGIQDGGNPLTEDQCTIDDPCPTLPCDQLKMAIDNEQDPTKKQAMINDLIMQYAAKDTTGTDSLLIEYLSKLNTSEAKKLLVPLYIAQNNFIHAQNTLTSLKSKTDIDYVDYYTFMIGFAQSKNQLSSVTANDKNTLHNIVNNKTLVSNLAENLLMKINEGNFKHHIMPIGNKTPRLISKNLSNSIVENIFVVEPNPSNGNFNLKLNVYESKVANKIMVTDMVGQQLYKHIANSVESRINLSHLANGIYQITLYKNDKFVSGQKLIIQN
ncbi:MAG: T9SS type A sorting domain-containing protein [Bacteroidetes bacterium]|nr:T9SS type A sorting domain-containing protein [Bacteroidota bacterium]